jgi:hypothetical protein
VPANQDGAQSWHTAIIHGARAHDIFSHRTDINMRRPQTFLLLQAAIKERDCGIASGSNPLTAEEATWWRADTIPLVNLRLHRFFDQRCFTTAAEARRPTTPRTGWNFRCSAT